MDQSIAFNKCLCIPGFYDYGAINCKTLINAQNVLLYHKITAQYVMQILVIIEIIFYQLVIVRQNILMIVLQQFVKNVRKNVKHASRQVLVCEQDLQCGCKPGNFEDNLQILDFFNKLLNR